MEMFKVRIVANACITRWERGERTMNDILDSYNPTPEVRALISAEIVVRRPTLDFNAQ